MSNRNTQPIPKQIRILGKVYKVSTVKDFEDCGDCLDVKQQIRVAEDMPLALEQDTLLHEVLHALDFGMKTHMKERQVSALATGIIAVFRDNPAFIRYLLQEPQETNAGSKGK